jgi:CheY-like chemotaxis protein
MSKIIVIEDNPTNMMLVVTVLKNARHQVLLAEDASKCGDLSDFSQEKPDTIAWMLKHLPTKVARIQMHSAVVNARRF